jgi:hypothetical protein
MFRTLNTSGLRPDYLLARSTSSFGESSMPACHATLVCRG